MNPRAGHSTSSGTAVMCYRFKNERGTEGKKNKKLGRRVCSMHARLHHVCICFSGVSCRVCLCVRVRPGGELCALHSSLIETAGCSKVLLLLLIQQPVYRQEIFE